MKQKQESVQTHFFVKMGFVFLAALISFSCGVKKPPTPLYSFPPEAKYLTAEDASLAPADNPYPLLSPTPPPTFNYTSPKRDDQ